MELVKKIGFNFYDIKNENETEKINKLLDDGYFKCETLEIPIQKDNYNIVEFFKFNDETQTWLHYWENILDKSLIFNNIKNYKQQLSESDYKVIKNMEAQLVNEELPYNSVTLHIERQALRDKINELEELLKNN